MAKKKHEEEHVNLERWMVSYADFMTLLFATFVVLYALAQIDLKEFSKLEESIRSAFNSESIIDGGKNIMKDNGESILTNGQAVTDAVVPPMMEYISTKYETKSMEDIKNELDKQLKTGDIKDIDAKMTDRGLVITLNNANAFFNSGSAELTSRAKLTISTIGKLIKEKFNNHLIRVEGHTDNLPTASTGRYPSNWELSAARSASVTRFLIANYSFSPDLFTVIGYGDTKPVVSNATAAGREQNRRISIVLLKNQVAKNEPEGQETISQKNNEIKERRKEFNKAGMSDAAKELLKDDAVSDDDVIILDEYNKADGQKIKEAIHDFETNKVTEKKKIKVNNQ